MTDHALIATRVAEVRQEIADACRRSGRDPATVGLVAVTKNQDASVLPALRAAGIHDFGENRVEHLQTMQAAAQPGDRWHFIGRIQGRQLAKVAPLVHCLHSLCEADHVERLARACIQGGLRLPVFVQVNASGEASKAGATPQALPSLLDAIRAQPALELAGLMTMAPELGAVAGADAVRACFASVAGLARGQGLGGLSMGMSGDLAIAVEEGATVVRVGSRLFA